MLKFLLASPARYIGVLGPRKRTQRMRQEYDVTLKDGDSARLYAPVGLDIGADTPAEIALSVIAEMRAVMAARDGGQLRRRHAPIHDGQDVRIASRETAVPPFGLSIFALTGKRIHKLPVGEPLREA
jgi:xanthine/CO dehydrogenase XdhC/CoxF family maturation factor